MLFWLGSIALAGTVFVNGVDVSTLRDFTLEGVTVYFDANGDVRITAPQYEIKVLSPDDGTVSTPAPTTRTAPTPSPTTSRTTPPPASHGVAEGHWWIVTEDEGSTGHVVEVFVNGALAFTIRSGQEQQIEDVGPWLRPGSNTVRMRATSSGAGGGSMYVYIGEGSNDEGTLTMGTPAVQFGLGASREGTYEREYTLEVK